MFLPFCIRQAYLILPVLNYRSPQAISMNEWHVIRFFRTGRNGYLRVDGHQLVEGMASGAFTQLTLTLDLFVGGHRNYDEVSKSAKVYKSFKGCIQKVEIIKGM